MTFMNGTGRTNGFLVPARSATWAYSGTFCNTRLLTPDLAYRNDPWVSSVEKTRKLLGSSTEGLEQKHCGIEGRGEGKSLVEERCMKEKLQR